jgi:hypothetical protein
VIIGVGVLLLATARPLDYRSVKIVAGPHKVIVSAALGAVPHALLVSENDTVTWCRPETGSFSVEFKNSPFKDGRTKFTDKDCDTNPPVAKAATPNDADVYKYALSVDSKEIDPHVIIVGGGPIE